MVELAIDPLELSPYPLDEGTHVGAIAVGALAGREWMLGAQFTAADVMIGSTLVWCQMMGMVGAQSPNVGPYLARCAGRSGFQRANTD